MTPFVNDFRNRILPNWSDILRGALERGATLGERGVFAFDLDSTLFDNLPRQCRIVREYGEAQGIAVLKSMAPEHWISGWDLRAAMQACGLSPEDVARHYDAAKRFWADRFFTSPYCLDDVAIPGAAEFVQKAASTGAQIAYVTGRHEGMREGTVGAFRQYGFALPGGNVHLMMKPAREANDDAFKREAHAFLGTLGTLIAAFDNEPTHVNDYRTRFPEALAIHLATDHSGRDVTLLDGVITVPHFVLVDGVGNSP